MGLGIRVWGLRSILKILHGSKYLLPQEPWELSMVRVMQDFSINGINVKP